MPIPEGIIDLVGVVSSVDKTSLKVRVKVFVEQMYSYGRETAITGEFTFVAINENKVPVVITQL